MSAGIFSSHLFAQCVHTGGNLRKWACHMESLQNVYVCVSMVGFLCAWGLFLYPPRLSSAILLSSRLLPHSLPLSFCPSVEWICADWSSLRQELALLFERGVARAESGRERERKTEREVGEATCEDGSWAERCSPFPLKYTALLKSIRMVIKEWQKCRKEKAAVERNGWADSGSS